MSSLSTFFHFCAGSNQSLLTRTPTDSNKFAGIGATIFFTGIFAAIAGGFAIFTVFNSYSIAVLFGIIWGLMIFNLDRFIVMSMKKKGSKSKEFFIAAPRLFLAILIAFVIAKPLELKLFDSEIQGELVIMEQEVFKTQEDKLKERFQPTIDSIQNDIALLQNQIETKRAKRDELNLIAIQEADGTGGSMQRNLGPIYMAKKQDADFAQGELDKVMADVEPMIANHQSRISELETLQADGIVALKRTAMNGFAARLDALGRLSKKSNTILWASIFITLLFIAIETAPIFTKLISDKSPYDYKLDEHESKFQNRHALITQTANVVTSQAVKFEIETAKYKNQLAIGAEKELVKELIKQEVEKLKDKTPSWDAYIKMRNKFGAINS